VYSQLETLYGEAHSLRQTLVCLLRAEGGGGILEEQHTAWLQNLALFMTESFELAKRLHRAHTDHSKILVRRILCALWNKQVDERRYMDDDCHPERKIEDMTQQVTLLSREIENHQKKMMQLRTLLTQDMHKVSASVPEGANGVVKGEEMEPDTLLEMYISVNSGSMETGEQLQNVDTSFAEMQRLMTNIKEELQLFKGLQDELHIVTGPSDQCVGQYHEVVRDIAVCMIRDEMIKKAQDAELARAKREQEEEAKRAQEDLLKDEEEMELNKKRDEEKKAKKKAKEKEKKEKERVEKERVRAEEEAKKRVEEEKRAAEEQAILDMEKKDAVKKRQLEEERERERRRENARKSLNISSFRRRSRQKWRRKTRNYRSKRS